MDGNNLRYLRKKFLKIWNYLKIQIDSQTNHICLKIEHWFKNEQQYIAQAAWCYMAGIKMFESLIEMQKFGRFSRSFDLAKGQFQFWRNQLIRDLHQWEQTS